MSRIFRLTNPTWTPNARFVRAQGKQGIDISPHDLGLFPCPAAGGGVHDWIYATACQLVRDGLSDDEVIRLLADGTRDVGRGIYEREVLEAVRNARAAVHGRDVGKITWSRRVRKPSQQEKLHALARARRESGVENLEQLRASSPCAVPESADEFIDALFPDECLICSGSEVWTCEVRCRRDLRGRWEDQRHIVPSPMISRTGLNKSGETSARCLDNTGPRRFLVLESDELGYDDASAILAWIGLRFPLVAVVYSGNKSLHGWFWVEGRDEDDVDRLRADHELLWLDRATFTACHPVRTPGVVRRDTGRLQQCLWFAGVPVEGGTK